MSNSQKGNLYEIDVSQRYPRSYDLIQKFTPNAILIDKYGTALLLPIAILGCLFVILIHVHILITGDKRRDSSQTTNRTTINEIIKSDLPTAYPTNSKALSNWTITHSIFLATIASAMLSHGLILAILDVDWAWNIAILAWSSLTCSTTHVIDATFHIWIQFLSIFLVLNAYLRIIDPRKRGFFTKRLYRCFIGSYKLPSLEANIYNLIFDDRTHRIRAIKICLLSFILSLLIGFAELMYWGIEYFPDLNFQKGLTVTTPFCEVSTAPNGLSRLFFAPTSVISEKLNDNPYGKNIQTEQNSRAYSYIRYSWFKVLFIELPCTILNLLISLKTLRVVMLDNLHDLDKASILTGGSREYIRMSTVTAANRFWADNAKLAIGISLMIGILSIPKTCIILLFPLALPSSTLANDQEIESNPRWKQFLLMTLAKHFTIEFYYLSYSMLVFLCLCLHRRFYKVFLTTLGCPWIKCHCCWLLMNCIRNICKECFTPPPEFVATTRSGRNTATTVYDINGRVISPSYAEPILTYAPNPYQITLPCNCNHQMPFYCNCRHPYVPITLVPKSVPEVRRPCFTISRSVQNLNSGNFNEVLKNDSTKRAQSLAEITRPLSTRAFQTSSEFRKTFV